MAPETEHKEGILATLTALLSDQIELLGLEVCYESELAVRRLVIFLAAALLALAAFAIGEVLVYHALVHFGLSRLVSSLLLALANAAGALLLVFVAGRRDPRAGRPFEGSRRQAQENLAWIRKLFS